MRYSYDDYFLTLAFVVSTRSRDVHTQHGCVIVADDKKIVSTGYNGFIKNIDDSQLPLERPEKYNFMLHAEENAILNCSYIPSGSNLTAYVTGKPCLKCLQLLIQFGVKRIVQEDRQGTKLENQETLKNFNKIVSLSKVKIDIKKIDFSIIVNKIKNR